MIEELNSLSTGLVGREAEYDMIARAITTLEAGVGGVVLVEGVGGIGKSALLSEFHRYAEGRRFPTFVGTSASPDRDRPFGAIFDALGCTAERLRRIGRWQSTDVVDPRAVHAIGRDECARHSSS